MAIDDSRALIDTSQSFVFVCPPSISILGKSEFFDKDDGDDSAHHELPHTRPPAQGRDREERSGGFTGDP